MKKLFLIIAIAVIGICIVGEAVPALGITEEDFLFTNLANDRAVSYYVSGLVVTDSDEANGNAYNWAKSGTVMIDGKVQKMDDGFATEDRCVPSTRTDVNTLEQELVEYFYAYNFLEGVEVKRAQLSCSIIQWGTECKAGACVPVPVPPDDFVITKTGKCKWMFGDCACPSGYSANYDTANAFCESKIDMTWMYNVLSGNWEKVHKGYYYDEDSKPHPEWIYDNSHKDSFVKAVATFNAGPKPFQVNKPDRDPTPQCFIDLVNSNRLLFDSCFQQVGPNHRFDLADCVAKDGGDAYKQAALKCEHDYQNSRDQSIQPPVNVQPSNEQPAEQPLNVQPSNEQSVGVSSLNIRELARANAEFQRAQANLDNIKKENDQRWNAIKNFSADYNSALERELANSSLSQEAKDALRKDIAILELKPEDIREIVGKGNELPELNDSAGGTKDEEGGDYGMQDFANDANQAVGDYNDLREKGVSKKDAVTKSVFDNFGTSALTTVPVIKAVDEAATAPDKILENLGVDENNWWRVNITNGIIGKFSPSALIKQITELMLENNSLSDIDDTLRFAWSRVLAANGAVATAKEAVKFTVALVGAGPVALARGISDVVGGTIFVSEEAVNFADSLFTYSIF